MAGFRPCQSGFRHKCSPSWHSCHIRQSDTVAPSIKTKTLKKQTPIKGRCLFVLLSNVKSYDITNVINYSFSANKKMRA